MNKTTSLKELAAFISFAYTYPNKFLCLVDSYNTLNSGVPNFLCVAAALLDANHKPIGVRLDSGDLCDLSIKSKEIFN
jgi:nicotinate phosphoribosyltransferase